MLNIEFQIKYKSLPVGEPFSIPDFTVITGKNGSGKTHLLEALADGNFTSITDDGSPLRHNQLVKFGEVRGVVRDSHQPESVGEHDGQLWNELKSLQVGFMKEREVNPALSQDAFLSGRKREQSPSALELIKHAETEGLSLDEIDQGYVNSMSKGFDQGHGRDIFSVRLAQLFNSYNVRHYDNAFQNFLHSIEDAEEPGLTDSAFEERFGPKPWHLVNDILKRIRLGYEVIPPGLANYKQPYSTQLVDKENDIVISPVDLSTGERVLIALALAIYNTHAEYGKPDVLLLDEPDAPLHPEFSGLMIEVLREIVVDRAKVRVILTTHSPSTVAMCPEESIFEMNRSTGRPNKVSRDQGIAALTRHIPHLRVTTEERRQVFVESKYDVFYYGKLFDVLRRSGQFGFEPVFLQPHSGSSNCTDVKNIVSRLRDSGGDLVRGIIDWDRCNAEESSIYVLGAGNRYSIENYILDPLYVALALIRAGKKSFSELGVDSRFAYVDAGELSKSESQSLADSILALADLPMEELLPCILENGWTVLRPKAFLEMNGHRWEAQIIARIPELNELIGGRTEDDKLKNPVLVTINEYPGFLSVDFRATLVKLD